MNLQEISEKLDEVVLECRKLQRKCDMIIELGLETDEFTKPEKRINITKEQNNTNEQ